MTQEEQEYFYKKWFDAWYHKWMEQANKILFELHKNSMQIPAIIISNDNLWPINNN